MPNISWSEVFSDIEDAVGYFNFVGEYFESIEINDPEASELIKRRDEMVVMHAIQIGYTSLENAFKRILNVLGEPLPVGDSYHSDLIKRVSKVIDGSHERPAIISNETYKLADQLRRFRHVAVRSYRGFSLDSCEDSVEAARLMAEVIHNEINVFVELIDPDVDYKAANTIVPK